MNESRVSDPLRVRWESKPASTSFTRAPSKTAHKKGGDPKTEEPKRRGTELWGFLLVGLLLLPLWLPLQAGLPGFCSLAERLCPGGVPCSVFTEGGRRPQDRSPSSGTPPGRRRQHHNTQYCACITDMNIDFLVFLVWHPSFTSGVTPEPFHSSLSSPPGSYYFRASEWTSALQLHHRLPSREHGPHDGPDSMLSPKHVFARLHSTRFVPLSGETGARRTCRRAHSMSI